MKKKLESKVLFSATDLKQTNNKNDISNNINNTGTVKSGTKSKVAKKDSSDSAKSLRRANSASKVATKSGKHTRKDNDKTGSDICDSKTNSGRSATTKTNKVKKSANTTKKSTTSSKKSSPKNNELKCDISSPKVKVGRKDRKHNWWNGCDYVWVDGIDHWVSKSAFRYDNKPTTDYTLQNYVPGLDSFYIMFKMPKSDKISDSIEKLKLANKELKSNYSTWNELSKDPRINDAFILKYEQHINMLLYFLMCRENGIPISTKIMKKYKDVIKIVNII